MCDDYGFGEAPDEDEPEDEWPDDVDLEAMSRELFGDLGDDNADETNGPTESEEPPSPGERVLYALGQLGRLHRTGKLPVPPTALDIRDVARLVGVAYQLEFDSEDRLGRHFHFPAEVLTYDPERSEAFPWRLLGSWEWAAEQMLNSFWAEGLDSDAD